MWSQRCSNFAKSGSTARREKGCAKTMRNRQKQRMLRLKARSIVLSVPRSVQCDVHHLKTSTRPPIFGLIENLVIARTRRKDAFVTPWSCELYTKTPAKANRLGTDGNPGAVL